MKSLKLFLNYFFYIFVESFNTAASPHVQRYKQPLQFNQV